jgi:hypothetical protein
MKIFTSFSNRQFITTMVPIKCQKINHSYKFQLGLTRNSETHHIKAIYLLVCKIKTGADNIVSIILMQYITHNSNCKLYKEHTKFVPQFQLEFIYIPQLFQTVIINFKSYHRYHEHGYFKSITENS